MRKISKIISFLLGFICIWPVFINLITGDILAFDFDDSLITAAIDDGAPVPIGFFSLVIFLTVFGLASKGFASEVPKLIAQFIMLSFLFIKIGFMKIVALFSPVVALYALGSIQAHGVAMGLFVRGFLAGVFALYALNIFSYLYYSAQVGDFGWVGAGRQILGYEIYQFFVSYSAVASLIFGVSYLLLFANKYELRYSNFILISLVVLSGIVVVLAHRKAALADMFFALLMSFLYLLSNVRSRNITTGTLAFPFVLAFVLFSYTFFNSLRDISADAIVDQRAETYYYLAQEFVSLDLVGFLFGFQTGFGGYSNLLIDLFVRGGFVGVLLYLFILLNVGQKTLRRMFIFCGSDERNGRSVIIIALIFVLFNIAIGNVANLNLIVPYYFVNLIAILAMLSYGFSPTHAPGGYEKNK